MSNLKRFKKNWIENKNHKKTPKNLEFLIIFMTKFQSDTKNLPKSFFYLINKRHTFK